jgi:formate dehydrogenase subunit gamma
MPGSAARTAAVTSRSGSQREVGPAQAGSEPAAARLLRFDGVERAAHWATALLFAILMATALPLYFVQVESLVGRRALIADIHTWSGVALPVPLIISLMGPWGKRLRRDVRRCNLWTTAEIRWLWSFGRQRIKKADKFNPGQKLNVLFVAGAIVVMLGTGSVLRWYRFFPLSWRTGGTFVHDVLAFAVFLVVLGHVAFALTHRDALRSMFWGWVTRSWAKRHASGWLEEEEEEEEAGSPEAEPVSTI